MRRSSLLIVFSLCCCQILRADEASAIKSIEEAGGTVRVIAADSEDKEAAFHLSDKDITDASLASLKEVGSLVTLNLRGTKVTDDGLKHVGELKTLKKLHLEKTEIGDAGVAHLAGLENLEYLNLYGTRVTDEGLSKLANLKQLKRLYLWKSQATEAGANKLKESLPELYVNLGSELKVVKVEPVEEKKDEPKKEEKKKDEAKAEPPKKTLAKGRFVKVRLQGDGRILSLAEVLVVETNSGKKLQTEGKASQSSVDYGGEPKRAIDGNTDQIYSGNSVTHTKTEKDPWWQVDLGAVKDIGLVKVYNRSDCCGDRLREAIVEIMDAEKKVVYTGKIVEATDGSKTEFVAN